MGEKLVRQDAAGIHQKVGLRKVEDRTYKFNGQVEVS